MKLEQTWTARPFNAYPWLHSSGKTASCNRDSPDPHDSKLPSRLRTLALARQQTVGPIVVQIRTHGCHRRPVMQPPPYNRLFVFVMKQRCAGPAVAKPDPEHKLKIPLSTALRHRVPIHPMCMNPRNICYHDRIFILRNPPASRKASQSLYRESCPEARNSYLPK